MRIGIVVDSACDVPSDFIKQEEITILPVTVQIGLPEIARSGSSQDRHGEGQAEAGGDESVHDSSRSIPLRVLVYLSARARVSAAPADHGLRECR